LKIKVFFFISKYEIIKALFFILVLYLKPNVIPAEAGIQTKSTGSPSSRG